MTEQKHTHEPMNVDEALSTSEAFLIKNKNVFLGAIVAIVVIVGGFLAYNHFIATPKEIKETTNTTNLRDAFFKMIGGVQDEK